MSETPIGFIGLGQIGGPMASRLADWPGGCTVFDVVPEATAACAALGATVAESPAEVAARSRVISVMVRDDAQVASVLDGPDGILRRAEPGTVVAIHSTISAEAPARFAAMAEPHGVHILDAPVSGGMMGAASGTLAIMLGGSDEAVALARGPLERLGTLVAHLGPLGAGTAAKLARNLITFASYAAVGEAMRLGEAMGIDLAQLGQVVRHSDAVTGGPGAIMLRSTAEPMDESDGLLPIFTHTYGLGSKDLELAIALGTGAGLPMPVAETALDGLASALGLPGEPA